MTVPVTPLSPPGRTAGESEPVFIFAQSGSRLDDTRANSKARGRGESCTVMAAVSCRMLGVQGSKIDVLVFLQNVPYKN